MTTRILLVDDHQILLDSLKTTLEDESGLEIVGELKDGNEVTRAIERLRPDLVVLDIALPGLNGTEAARRIRTDFPDVRVVALSAHSDKHFVLNALEAGVNAYVLKADAAHDLLEGIQAATKGEKYLSPGLAGSALQSYVAGHPAPAGGGDVLGDREREVLQLLAEGRSNHEIASTLHISAATVSTHRRNIMRKLDIHNLAELTRYAIRHGLTTSDT